MLLELSVQDLAVIESCELSLRSGFTALTGETGAGKSLLIDAIGLALGDRADSGLVRTGAKKASVTLKLDISGNPTLLKACEQLGFETEGELVVRRDVSAEGRSTVRVNEQLASVGALKSLGQLIVDLHGQHEHQSLLDEDRQIEFLDSWIGEPAVALISEVTSRYAAVQDCKRKIDALQMNRRELEQRVDMLNFQIQEIEEISPVAGEFEELEASLSRLQNAEKLTTAANGAIESLYDKEGAATEALGVSIAELESCAQLDPAIELLLDSLRSAAANLEDAGRELRAYAGTLDLDPTSLEEVAARLDGLKRLRRKYGDDEIAVLAFLDQAKGERDSLVSSEQSEAELEAELSALQKRLDSSAGKLTKLREKSGQEFGKLVQANLKELAMDGVEFSVVREEKPVQSNGADRIVFYFSANPGEPAQPLHHVASGGELSRIMLAIKVASAGKAGVPTLIFDEVDAGLSGKAAAVTAKKLVELGRHFQVIVISHLPQISSQADQHFRIAKEEKGGRVHTTVLELEGDDRVAEVARLLGGEKVSETALANARELIGK